jgi:hypothetical protein
MKKLLLTSALLIATLACFAQKNIDLDNYWFTVVKRMPPATPQKPLFFDYMSVVRASSSTNNKVSVNDLQAYLGIDGQRKVNEVGADGYVFCVNLGSFVVKSSQVSERREEVKNKDGIVTDFRSYFRVNVIYSFEAGYQLIKGGQPIITRTIYSPSSTKTYSTAEYSSWKAASDFWQNNRDNFIADMTQKLAEDAIVSASNSVSQLVGFYVASPNEKLQITDEKKHPENEAFRAACTFVRDEAKTITPNAGMDESKLAGVIDYFSKIPQKYTDPKLKADIKLRYAAYYNLAKIYIFLDQPEKAKEYANLLIANGYDKKDGEKLIKEANNLSEALQQMPNGKSYFNPEDYWGR